MQIKNTHEAQLIVLQPTSMNNFQRCVEHDHQPFGEQLFFNELKQQISTAPNKFHLKYFLAAN